MTLPNIDIRLLNLSSLINLRVAKNTKNASK